MSIVDLKVNLFSHDRVGVSWDFTGSPATFVVSRSESPEGPFDVLTNIPISAMGFVDIGAARDSYDRTFYYRVQAFDGSLSEVDSAVVSAAEGEGSYIGRYIARLEDKILLQRFSGTKCQVFIRRTQGERCGICYDKIRHKSIDDNCPICYGTGFRNPFFRPITMFINFNPRPRGSAKDEVSSHPSNVVTARASNYPVLKEGDLIIEVERQNDRYVIAPGLQTTEFRQAVVSQTFQALKVPSSHPFSKIRVEPDSQTIDDVCVFRKIYP